MNFDNFKSENIDSPLKEKLTLKDPTNKKKKKVKPTSSDSDIDDEDFEEFEALLASKFHKGKGKYKGKLPIICFNYNEVGHIEPYVLKRKRKKVKTNIEVERMRVIKVINIKERKPVTLLRKNLTMDQKIMIMKLYMLL